MVIRVRFNNCTSLEVCTLERDLQFIVPFLLQVRGDVHSTRDEHAIRLKDLGAIEKDGSKGV